MKETFLVEGSLGMELSFQEVLSEVNTSRYFFPYLKYTTLKQFYINLITGLASGNEVTILDPDFSEDEIVHLLGSADLLNKKVEVNLNAGSFEEIIELIEKGDGLLTLFTSGTTGLPKKVAHQVQNLTRGVRRSATHLQDVWALAYNPTHMAGIQVFFQALYNQNRMVNVFQKSRDDIFDAIREQEITHISGTPTFFRMLLPADQTFQNVKRITFGGERSDTVLHDKIRLLFPNASVNNIYASTEAGTLLIGRGDEFQIRDEVAGLVEIKENELLVHRSLIGKNDDLKLSGDWYHTSDIVEITSESPLRFKIISRGNDLINVGGNKVNPNEVEDCLLKLDNIKECRVYGRPNSVLGTILCAEYVTFDNEEIEVHKIKSKLSEWLQDFKIPRIIKQVQSLDTTRTGKLKR